MCKLFFYATNSLMFVWIFFLFIKMIKTFEAYMRFEKEKVDDSRGSITYTNV